MPAEQEINELIFRGFSAQIRIGDRPLTIYKPDYDEETKTASGWIASEPGKEYFVCWKKNDVAEYAASGRVSIDGILRAGGFMPGHENQLQGEVGADNEDGDEDDEEAQAEAEIAALQAALKVRVASLAKRKGVKQEDVEADLARKRRKVKQEEAINADLYFTPGEVIDLTDL
ncbi:hypothetical protein FRC05_010188 [Tulasnella sp. 425]|nr:hypothetical protein FRC05_010188 [Tulasnella sp. 425]